MQNELPCHCTSIATIDNPDTCCMLRTGFDLSLFKCLACFPWSTLCQISVNLVLCFSGKGWSNNFQRKGCLGKWSVERCPGFWKVHRNATFWLSFRWNWQSRFKLSLFPPSSSKAIQSHKLSCRFSFFY